MPLWPRPCLMVMLVSRFVGAAGAVAVRAGETETLEGAVERVAVVRVDWEVLLRTERRESDRRDEAAELCWDGSDGRDGRGEGMAAAEGRLDVGRAMTNGMRLMGGAVCRTLARSSRDRPSADTGRVRASEGAGQAGGVDGAGQPGGLRAAQRVSGGCA